MEATDRLKAPADLVEPECPVELAIRTIGGKRKMLILRRLLLVGDQRYNELLRGLEGISAKVLTQNLRELVREGVVRRRVLSQAPLRVRYELTPTGRDLMPIYRSLGAWQERLVRQLARDGTDG